MRQLAIPLLLLASVCSALYVAQNPGEGSFTLEVGPQAEPHALEGAMNVNEDATVEPVQVSLHNTMSQPGAGMFETPESTQNGQSNERHLKIKDVQNENLPEHVKHKSLRDIWQKELPCECPFNKWKPVCGVDGQTYPTECFADCIGVEVFVHADCKYVKRELWARMHAKLGNVATDYFEDGAPQRKSLESHPYYSGESAAPEPYPEEEGVEDEGPAPEAEVAVPAVMATTNTAESQGPTTGAQSAGTPAQTTTTGAQSAGTPAQTTTTSAQSAGTPAQTTTTGAQTPANTRVEEPAARVASDPAVSDASQTSAEDVSEMMIGNLGPISDAIDGLPDPIKGLTKNSHTAQGLNLGVAAIRDLFSSGTAEQENVQISQLDRRMGRHISSQHHTTHEASASEDLLQVDAKPHIEWREFNGMKVPYDTRDIPNPCPHCPLSFHPVCGHDSKTYPTACFARCVGIEIAGTGECDSEA